MATPVVTNPLPRNTTMSDTEQTPQIEANIPMSSVQPDQPSFDSFRSTDQDLGATDLPVVLKEESKLPPSPAGEVKLPTEFRVKPEDVEKAIGSTHYSTISDFSTKKITGVMSWVTLRNGYQTPAIPVISLPRTLHDEDADLAPLEAEATKLARDHIWMLLGYQAMSRLNNYEYKVPKLAPGEEITREFLNEHYVSEEKISGHLAIDYNGDQSNPEIFNSFVRFPNARLAALVLKNGYTFFGLAQVVDIRNDVPSIGQSVAFEDAYRQLYQLAVYEQMEMAYQERLAAEQETSAT